MLRFTIFLGADHAGFSLKEELKQSLIRSGTRVVDLTPTFCPDDDYPPIGRRVARLVVKIKSSRGILICGSGTGVAIAANRVRGARAFVAHDEQTTRLARAHNDANIMALAGWEQTVTDAQRVADVFFKTPFSTALRHRRRVKELK